MWVYILYIITISDNNELFLYFLKADITDIPHIYRGIYKFDFNNPDQNLTKLTVIGGTLQKEDFVPHGISLWTDADSGMVKWPMVMLVFESNLLLFLTKKTQKKLTCEVFVDHPISLLQHWWVDGCWHLMIFFLFDLICANHYIHCFVVINYQEMLPYLL